MCTAVPVFAQNVLVQNVSAQNVDTVAPITATPITATSSAATPSATTTSAAASITVPSKTVPAKTSAPNSLQQIPATSFAKIPFIELAQISPNGEMIAGLLGIQGEQRIAAFSLNGNMTNTINLGVIDNMQVTSVSWVNDTNLAITVSSLMPVETENWYVSRVLGVNTITKKVTKLFFDSKGQNAADILWIPKDGTNEILIAAQDSIYSTEPDRFWPSIYKIDVTTGKKKKVVYSKEGVMDWSSDASGNIRSAVGYNDEDLAWRLLYRNNGTDSFKIIDRAKYKKSENLRAPFMYVAGTDNGYVIHDNDKGMSGIYEVNLLTGAPVKTVFDAKESDVENTIISYDGTKLLGVTTTASNGTVTWFDPDMAALQSIFDNSIKGGKPNIVSFNRDQSKILLRVSGPDTPGVLYYYDRKIGAIQKIAAMNDQFGPRRLSPVKMIKYTARDGLSIEGILTLPKGADPKNLPFIVMPHGGPWANDTLSYDYWAQFIASRGYGVLQPNFRGSTGYGTEFLDKGKGQMGFAMQDDITDGVKWAVAQGIADPKRVCIVGASYGGYAAMWGVVKDPDLYKCAVSIAGVSLLRKEVNDFGGSLRGNLYTRQWEAMTPDFAAVSPIKFVDKIKAPLLLIHGKKDITVDHVQSEKMNAAMKRAGKTVEFVSVPLADHYFTREADRITLLTAIETFLAKHNPVN